MSNSSKLDENKGAEKEAFEAKLAVSLEQAKRGETKKITSSAGIKKLLGI